MIGHAPGLISQGERVPRPSANCRLLPAIILTALLQLSPYVFSGETITDNALWAGGLLLREKETGLDYSVEYQLRLDDDMSSLSSQFVEFLGYHKATENLLFNGGYRFTKRSDRDEHRLYLGGFVDLTKSSRGLWDYADRFRATLQLGYQHDFNVKFDDRLIDSNSIRMILVASRPGTDKLRPFVLGGVLTTWNDAYSFGVDKIRLGAGFQYQFNKQSRMRLQYIWEKAKFRTPEKQTNIIWLRYERRFGD